MKYLFSTWVCQVHQDFIREIRWADSVISAWSLGIKIGPFFTDVLSPVKGNWNSSGFCFDIFFSFNSICVFFFFFGIMVNWIKFTFRQQKFTTDSATFCIKPFISLCMLWLEKFDVVVDSPREKLERKGVPELPELLWVCMCTSISIRTDVIKRKASQNIIWSSLQHSCIIFKLFGKTEVIRVDKAMLYAVRRNKT